MAYSCATTQTDLSISCRNNVHNQYNEDPLERDDIFSQIDDNDESEPSEIDRRLHPKCKGDIQLLFSELHLWRDQKLYEIEQKRDICLDDRIKLRSGILSQETYLLRKLSQINHFLHSKEQMKKIDDILLEVARPKKWKIACGETITVQTPDTEHSSELVRIYQKLDESGSDLTISKRLKVLDEAKVKLSRTYDSSSVKEICSLIEREKEFLTRGLYTSLNGLRSRISHLFLHFLKRNIATSSNLCIEKNRLRRGYRTT